MNIKRVISVYKKEMLEILRDKKTLIIMILVPVLLYPLIMLFSMQMGVEMAKQPENPTIYVGYDELDLEVESRLKNYPDANFVLKEISDGKTAIENQEVDLFISYDETEKKYTILNDAASTSYAGLNAVEEVLDEYKEEMVEGSLIYYELNPDEILNPLTYEVEDIVKSDSMVAMLLGMILPFLLITVIMLGAMYPAIDITAGEKERGTLETMMTLPITNLECISGKFAAVATIASITGILNFISIMLTGVFMVSQMMLATDFEISYLALLPGMLVTLVCILLFAMFISAVVMCVCMFANSFKEANNYITPLTLVIMLPMMVTMMPDVTLSLSTAALPVVNIALMIKSALMGTLDVLNGSIVLVTNALYAFIAVYVLSLVFKSESILFKEGNASFFEFRANIQAKEVPHIADALLVYLVTFILLIYVAPLFQLKMGFNGLMLTQGLILAVCVGSTYYLKADLRKTFHLKFPKVLNFVSSIFIWAGVFTISMVLSQLLISHNTDLMETANALEKVLSDATPAMIYFVVCLLPAICEEMFFRGFILSSLRNKMKPGYAIIITGVLFGMYHMNLVQMLPATLLGMSLAYITVKADSIYPAMVIHLINNSFAMTSSLYPQKFAFLNKLDASNPAVLAGLAFIGLGFFGLGILLTRKVNQIKQVKVIEESEEVRTEEMVNQSIHRVYRKKPKNLAFRIRKKPERKKVARVYKVLRRKLHRGVQ